MTLQFHDTLQRRKLPFAPLVPGRARLYHCGPTVYGAAHIGNFRAFLFADVLRRWLELKGLAVTQVMNITDVGHLRDDDPERGADKMEEAARKESLDPWKIAEKYTDLFLADVDRLRIRRAHHYPRATGHVPQMIDQIGVLLDKGLAYEAGGNVYFAVDRFPAYGRLSGNSGDDLRAGARVDVRDEKRDPRDFALWKRDPHHLMQWDSPWGRGFPGWHIECSAMSQHLLGPTLDIHTGGEDNIFPHHECEIAQAEGATGSTFARHWMHTRFLQVEGQKMSKSLGNLHTVGDLQARGHGPLAVRLLLIRVHYRQVLNFTFDGLTEAAGNVHRLRLCQDELAAAAGEVPAGPAPEWVSAAVARFDGGLDDDLNMSAALDGVFTLVGEAARRRPRGDEAAAALAALRRFDQVLDVLTPEPPAASADDAAVDALMARRREARARRDFAAADALRKELEGLGLEILDGKDGQATWRRRGS